MVIIQKIETQIDLVDRLHDSNKYILHNSASYLIKKLLTLKFFTFSTHLPGSKCKSRHFYAIRKGDTFFYFWGHFLIFLLPLLKKTCENDQMIVVYDTAPLQ